MPIEAKPLFRPDVLRTHLAAFQMPANVDAFRPKLVHWADLLSTGKANTFKEQEILPDFLTDFFCGLLGYTRPADGGPRYTISREKHVQVDGKFADAVLGEFGRGQDKFIVALEGKGPKDPLDRPFAGRRMSAVDQGYRYAINLPCDFVIVTSIRQTRLYHKGSDQHTYEAFDAESLADSDAMLKRFVFLLGAERVVHESGRCHFYELLTESERVGKDLTREFYERYADMRHDAFQRLCRDNPDVPRHDVLSCAQKLLDRVLFCAFCEDRGLLPGETIRKAFEHRDPYHPRPIWENFRGLFQAVNCGNAALGIHAYNGGLFGDDPVLDRLKVSNEVCAYFRELGDYDYRPAHQATYAPANGNHSLIDVDILGHIFEQSITDLERLRDELDDLRGVGVSPAVRGAGVPPAQAIAGETPTLRKQKTRRKKEGAFYTPAFITRYIIEQALGGVLRDRFEQLRQSHQEDARAAARAALADPAVYVLDKLKKPERAALVRFWEAWQDELANIRLLDPACGSGAFLIEAFDQLHAAYRASNDRLAELRGHRTLFDLDKQILENNLYGVDLNEEAIEICRLSLWIKTAEKGKVLTSLDHTIRVGNSIVADPAVHPKAFDWQAAFPGVFSPRPRRGKGAGSETGRSKLPSPASGRGADRSSPLPLDGRGAGGEGVCGGFDVVVANPPYVRQELLSPIKPYLQSAYRAYHGMADLYVYFYELGLRLLKPGGLLSYVVTNKWMKSGYAEPLRRFFQEEAWIQSVVDFGHAKQIFEDADVFPSIIVARRPTTAPKPTTARLCAIPREQLRIDDLSRQIEQEGVDLPLSQLGVDAWQLEASGVSTLLAKIRARGVPLHEYTGCGRYRGVTTGLNGAFVITAETRREIVKRDANSAAIIRPCLRGQDIARWRADFADQWLIFARRGIDIEAYPGVKNYLSQFRRELEPKPPDWSGGEWPGRKPGGYKWYELQDPIEFFEEFDRPKIYYQEIQFHPAYAYDADGLCGNNKTSFIVSGDLFLLGVLNSPLMWWHNWRYLPHMKDEALAPTGYLVVDLPIANPSDDVRGRTETAVARLIEITRLQQATRRQILDWLHVEYEVEKPTLKLQSPFDLDCDGLVAEVKKVRGKKKPLSAAALANLRAEYTRTIAPARTLAAEALTLENEVSKLVNEAYALTPEEVALLWQTAPPRMPIAATPCSEGGD